VSAKNLLGVFCMMTVVAFGLIGCEDGGGDHGGNNPFQGAYAGTYSGGYDGTWTVTIHGDGYTDGVAHNSAENADYDLKGMTADNGDMALTAGAASDGTQWRGHVDKAGHIGGTWSDGETGGGFSGQRQ